MLRTRSPFVAHLLLGVVIALVAVAVVPTAANAGRSDSDEAGALLGRPLTATFPYTPAPPSPRGPQARIPGHDDLPIYQARAAKAWRAFLAREWTKAVDHLVWVDGVNRLIAHQAKVAEAAADKAAADKAAAERAWYDGLRRAEAANEARQAREARAATPAPTLAPAPTPPSSGARSSACGGDLPPCYVLMRESGGNPTAQNPRSTASGLWQFLDSTWAGYGGFSRAMYAPASVQNDKARLVWAGGRGCAAWSAC